MIMTNKIVAVALITALIGASLGAAVMHSRDTSKAAETTAAVPTTNAPDAMTDARFLGASEKVPAEFATTQEQTAYKVGFTDGYNAAIENRNAATTRTVSYRSAPAYRSSANSRRVYYDYSRPKGRSFWSKHRDKLTLAMGAGGGALFGGLIGGKKGAAIGSLAGLGGSALYTYKLRKRNHNR
ncbi:MAG TPA: hypothetical protein VN643_02015 [Pyrinomonadaceae bacterium]|nr:hypothetical protein [Pyrinomonadaceae bacterium]